MPETLPTRFRRPDRLCSPPYRRANDVPRSMTEPISRSAIDEEGTARCACIPVRHRTLPQGLYDPANEHDACGVAFVATLSGRAEPRDRRPGADRAAQPRPPRRLGRRADSGDGAGILTQVPDAFLRAVAPTSTLPDQPARYAVGMRVPARRRRRGGRGPGGRRARSPPRRACASSAGATCPSTPALLGATARAVHAAVPPAVRRAPPAAGCVGHGAGAAGVLPAQAGRARGRRLLPVAVGRTLVYKGMLTTGQLEPFFPDLSDRRFVTELALVHSRFSTNTFPSWPLAHPYRLHRAQRRDQHRQGQPQLDARPREPARQRPDPRRPRAAASRSARPGASDSASFDEVLELLHLGGRSLPHAVLMMIPEAWENHAEMDPARRGVLRVPRRADGAVGRPGLRHLHRRHA